MTWANATISWSHGWDARVLALTITLLSKVEPERVSMFAAVDAEARRGMINPAWVWEWREARNCVRAAYALGLTANDLDTVRACLLADEREWRTRRYV
jgi:hypothetical protein